jgi:hypothetical protein
LREALREAALFRRALPGSLVEVAVDRDRPRAAYRVRAQRLRECGRREQREQQTWAKHAPEIRESHARWTSL